MKERFYELKFYYFIQGLFHSFGYDIRCLDVIESFCILGDVDLSVIKNLVLQIRQGVGIINTYPEETIAVFRQMGISFRVTTKITRIATSTQQRIQKEMEPYIFRYKDIEGKLPKEEYIEVLKFMKVVETIKEL